MAIDLELTIKSIHYFLLKTFFSRVGISFDDFQFERLPMMAVVV